MSADLDQKLRRAFCEHPRLYGNRFTPSAKVALLEILFRSLTNDRGDYLKILFPTGFPNTFRLQDEQGAQENTEYTEAARGHACGHIFKQGEANYHCMTCTDDPTAVLCARCFGASDHEGHQFHIGTSAGNSGCCDCGDDEAWKQPVRCAIHTAIDESMEIENDCSALPEDLQASIRTTISRALDYFCDVISCSPENLRTPKTLDSVQQDEVMSRLTADKYVVDDEVNSEPEYSLVLWNDEKHTVPEVKDQVARACRGREAWAQLMAEDADAHGRCVIQYSRNLTSLLNMAKLIEQIKITVTIRSSRDTFREQMCETIIEWLSDIAGCSIAGDAFILRRLVCEEMLQLWQMGSRAWNAKVGNESLDDHEHEDAVLFHRRTIELIRDPIQNVLARAVEEGDEDDAEDDEDEDMETTDQQDDLDSGDDEEYEILDGANTTTHVFGDGDPDITDDADEMDTDGDIDFSDVNERSENNQTAPPPPPPLAPLAPDTATEPAIAANTETLSRQESESAVDDQNPNYRNLPRLTSVRNRGQYPPPNHWTINTITRPQKDMPLHEDLRKNIRIDSVILFDLRLWKQVRTDIRDLLITTLVNIPQFKRILGLRFSGLYTTLAQLYLVADREPDHSIINLSLQLLTTPSITQEVVEKGNFLTVLMAILYTFLTTRQVGPPNDVDPEAVLGFDAGSVANRRLYHFFSDLRYFLASAFIRSKIRSERQYLFEYLDLAKLSQGICPNLRAVGEHVEYETDAWISASLLTREINRLCREFAEAFQMEKSDITSIESSTCQAVMHTARAAIINSIGLEHQRFEQSEIRDIVKFHPVGPYPFDQRLTYKVVDFVVDKGTLSFHHPLHYTLSWLLEGGKNSIYVIEALREAANTVVASLHEKNLKVKGSHLQAIYAEGEDALLALFDYPLRVCAWLAQMKANLWVRNGMSLRHQMSQYRSVAYRELGHHRDHFLLQTALVSCHPGRVLASIIDRYGLQAWMSGIFNNLPECEDSQTLEIIEDFTYLIINLLSDRDSLTSYGDEPESQIVTLRKDIAHTLCFKPLSFSELTNRLSERAQDHKRLQEVLESMTRYKPPEGINDMGLFELQEEFLDELDPYNSHFSKNQRDEAENIFKAWKAKKTGKAVDDIVLEPKLYPIRSEAYKDLCAIIYDPLFSNMIHSLLTYVALAKATTPNVSITRVEAFAQVLLHLVMVATLEDDSVEESATISRSFIRNALSLDFHYQDSAGSKLVEVLHRIWSMDDFSSCRSKIKHILQLFSQRYPQTFGRATAQLDLPTERSNTASPAVTESEVEMKKKQALERRKKIMAQMQQQQQSFMDKQGMVDWGNDDDDDNVEPDIPSSTEKRVWKCPSGVCIQCREETNDARLYGTFAMVTDDHILRQTPLDEPDFVNEVFKTPSTLDRSLEAQRPFGVSGLNHQQIRRLTSDGREINFDRQGLGKGWPHSWTEDGTVSTSCGHIMHFSCFENYYQSISRRHTHQIARNHPEIISLKEFLCPLCKALANVFLPIVWKSTEQSYPGPLTAPTSFDIYLDYTLPTAIQQQTSNGALHHEAEKRAHVNTILSFDTSAMAPLANLLRAEASANGDGLQNWSEYKDQPGYTGLAELSEAYHRLKQSLEITEKTQIAGLTPETMPNTPAFRLLLDTMANSVAAVEISYRGRESDYGMTLLSGIPATTLSHLQVLSASVHAFAASTALDNGDDFMEQHRHLVRRVITRLLQGKFDDKNAYKSLRPALEGDAFNIFVDAAMTIGRNGSFPLPHLLRLCLTLELVRVVAAFLSDPQTLGSLDPATLETQSAAPDTNLGAINALVGFIERQLHSHVPEDTSLPRTAETLNLLSRAVKTYTLVFLRKAVIFLHVASGVDFPPISGSEASTPELDRLTHLLKLPPVTSILSDFAESSGRYSLHKLARHWMHDSIIYTRHHSGNVTAGLRLIRLGHPAPFELIGLPKYFDVLIEESHRRKCPTTGKELTEPALCLFCGEIFCSQGVCCTRKWGRGGCNVHTEECSFPIGLFLFIRKCHVVLLRVVRDPRKMEGPQSRGADHLSRRDETISHGSFFSAPYLTKHGETDSGLRSKHQLILSQKRYDRLLRDTWLMVNASVWSTIARKLEGEVNAGGWETL